MNILRQGHARKRFAATEMNERSSRSHTALIIQVSHYDDMMICISIFHIIFLFVIEIVIIWLFWTCRI